MQEFKKRNIPIICHRDFQLISNTAQLTTYLICQFPTKMRKSLCKEENQAQIGQHFEWAASNLRPCTKFVIQFSMAMTQAGIKPNEIKDEDPNDATPSGKSTYEISPMIDGHGLQNMYETYLSKFKIICEQMENHFFVNDEEDLSEGPYIFGDDPSIFDFSLYHDLVAVMLVTGLGDGTRLFSQIERFSQQRIQRLNIWYGAMGEIDVNKKLVGEFASELKTTIGK